MIFAALQLIALGDIVDLRYGHKHLSPDLKGQLAFVRSKLFADIPLDLFIGACLDLRADIAFDFRKGSNKITLRSVKADLILVGRVAVFKVVVDDDLLARQLNFLDGRALGIRYRARQHKDDN